MQPMSSIKSLYPDHLRLIVYDNDDDDEFDSIFFHLFHRLACLRTCKFNKSIKSF